MKPPRSIEARMVREVRKVEAAARADNVQDAGTGQTIIKLQRNQPPLRTLLDAKKIGAVELHAAEQIVLAAFSVSTRGILRATSLERIDHGRSGDSPWPAHVALAVRNYQEWQRYWTREHVLTGNQMLEVIWSAVVDERPISVIAQEIGHSRHKTARAIVCGLRHYAAHARLITGIQADTWLSQAQHLFDRRLAHTAS